MTEKTKIIEIEGRRYQIRRFAPDIGSFILMQMIGASLKGVDFSEVPAPTGSAVTPTVEPSGEDTVRRLVFAAFLRGLEYTMHKFFQDKCLSVCSRMEDQNGTEVPMPIMNGSGIIAIPELRDDIQLVIRLEMEAMVFNFSDFFVAGGLNALAGKPASKV